MSGKKTEKNTQHAVKKDETMVGNPKRVREQKSLRKPLDDELNGSKRKDMENIVEITYVLDENKDEEVIEKHSDNQAKIETRN
jgi:hypothetical protein